VSELPSVDSGGRFHRCARCGWLDERSQSPCLQCGAVVERVPQSTAPIELNVVRACGEPRERSIDEIQAIRDAISARAPVHLAPITRTAIVELDGRTLLVAPDEERRRVATRAILEGLAALRGEIALWSDDGFSHGSDRIRPANSLADADVVVLARALSLPRAQREALSSTRWLIVSDPDPLSKSLSSLYELVAITRPEIARTRRSFLARFSGVDRSPATQAALGSLLARVVLRVAPDAPLPAQLAALDRWLDAAPRG